MAGAAGEKCESVGPVVTSLSCTQTQFVQLFSSPVRLSGSCSILQLLSSQFAHSHLHPRCYTPPAAHPGAVTPRAAFLRSNNSSCSSNSQRNVTGGADGVAACVDGGAADTAGVVPDADDGGAGVDGCC